MKEQEHVTISLTGPAERMRDIENSIIEKVAYRLDSRLAEEAERAVNEHLGKFLKEKSLELTEKHIEPLLLDVIAQGFPRTNEWGDHHGENVKLTEFIRQQLTWKRPNTRESWISKTLETVLRDTIGKEMRAEMEAAKAGFRQAVDERLGRELAEAARKAAGLK